MRPLYNTGLYITRGEQPRTVRPFTPDSTAATRDQIAGASGQPHRDCPDAGHMVQADVGADLAAHIADWRYVTQ